MILSLYSRQELDHSTIFIVRQMQKQEHMYYRSGTVARTNDITRARRVSGGRTERRADVMAAISGM